MPEQIDFLGIMTRLRPGSRYLWRDGGSVYVDVLRWDDPNTTQPTETECLAEWDVMLAERAAEKAERDARIYLEAAAKQQKVELLSLPNWATWTAQQAETNIEQLITNGITQEKAEAAVAAASSIPSLRPILTNLIKSVYAMNTILKAIAKCIVFIRDILKP